MNLNQLTYRKKLKLLKVALPAVLVIVYMLSVSKTMNLYFDVREQEKRSNELKNLPEKLKNVKEELNGTLVYQGVKNNVQGSLLTVLTTVADQNKVVIRQFPPIQVFEKKDFAIESAVVTVQGKFSDILNFVAELESRYQEGKVTSVNYKRVEHPYTHATSLIATLYIQSLKKGKSNV